MPVIKVTPIAMLNNLEAPYAKLLRDAGFEIHYPEDPTFTQGRDEDETIRTLKGATALIAGGDYLTRNVIEALPGLRVIARGGVGYDRVDVEAATERGIVVALTPAAIPDAVAEHTLALMLAVSRDITVQNRDIRAGKWDVLLSRPLRGTTLGLVGMGRIGRATVLRAKGFAMKIIATDPYADTDFAQEHAVDLVDFDTLLAQSDFVSIHTPLSADTQGMFNRDVFSKMKPGSVLINTSRGGLVVEADLMAALDSGHLAGAGLDVFEVEPTGGNHPLFHYDNVVLTPHKAALETLAQTNTAIEAAQCIVDLHQGRWPEANVLNSELKDGWTW